MAKSELDLENKEDKAELNLENEEDKPELNLKNEEDKLISGSHQKNL